MSANGNARKNQHEKDADVDRLTMGQIEKWRAICLSHWASDEIGTWLSHEESARQANALCDLALQSLSQEAVRDEALEEAAKVALTVLRRELGELPANVNAHDFGYAYAKGGNEMSQDIYNAILSLKREPNAAGRGNAGGGDGSIDSVDGPAPAAPDVSEMVKRLLHTANTPKSVAIEDWEILMRQAAALLAKLGQGWIPEPVAWRREWDGDVSDIGAMLYASSQDELDEPLSRWQPLYAKEPGASDE